jgi:hypothetical protein
VSLLPFQTGSASGEFITHYFHALYRLGFNHSLNCVLADVA